MHSHTTELKPLIQYKISSKTVTVQKPDAPAANIPIAEYNKMFNVSMSHGIFYNPKHQALVDALQKESFKKSGDEAAVKNFLDNPKTYFAVRYINKTCGYGLVALEDIPKGTVVGIYSSELIFKPSDEKETLSLEERAYDMNIRNETELAGERYDVSLRGNYYSDQTRFAPHFPSPEAREKLPLDNKIKRKNILTANMDFPIGVIDDKPIHYYITTEEIKKDNFAGIDYGDGYWRRRGKPCIFEKQKHGIRVNYFQEQKYVPSDEIVEAKLNRKRPAVKPEIKEEPNQKKRKMFHDKPSVADFSFLSKQTTPMEDDAPKLLFKRKTRRRTR